MTATDLTTYRAIDKQHSAVGRFLSLDQPSGIRFQTSLEKKLKNTFRLSLKTSFFRQYYVFSALEVFTTMRYINRRFTYLLTTLTHCALDCRLVQTTSSLGACPVVCNWMLARQALRVGSKSSLAKLSKWDCSIQIRTSTILPSTVVRDLGVHLDSELSTKQHISKVSAPCFYHLRRLRQIRRRAGCEVATRVVLALVM